uniref:voltage-dependent T-type calcium channel subunit alpha-1H-like n=2 Tax=Oncorhynchus gorbuscha TaxID=8017 RepID=UPI001EAE8F95|nr:voltage-dependent T-type calcium channel subunit alpha-1H-like [Oncorhynchus gorbuscha]
MTDGEGRVRFLYTTTPSTPTPTSTTPTLTLTPALNVQQGGEERRCRDGEVRVLIPAPFYREHNPHPSPFYREHNPPRRHHHDIGFRDDDEDEEEEGGSSTRSPGPEEEEEEEEREEEGAGVAARCVPGPPVVVTGGSSSGGVFGNVRREPVTEPVTEPVDPVDLLSEEEEQQPYPALAPVVFFCIKQTTRPRSWCLRTVCNPWFEHVSMIVILLNCVTLGMYQPCEDVTCQAEWCLILQVFDDCIFAFFAVEMVIKMVALGVFGSKCYLGDTWNRLDFFIVMAGMMEYSLDGHNASLSAIRTVRVLRPLRAINRVPSMRILVTLLLDTLPMLGNVLLLCFFVFFIFGIVGVQLWAGLLRNRCFMGEDFRTLYNLSLSVYYQPDESEEDPFICSAIRENGMLRCHDVPPYSEGGVECSLPAPSLGGEGGARDGCVNWNQYYNVCRPGNVNPHKGAVNFDNIAYAWIAIFQVITLEGWVDIMYYVMDAHSFYNFIYFIFLIIVGSFFMINLCLVVIATQFAETKQRENALMREQRARYMSNDSTLASYSEPGSCYEEMLRYVSHLYRKLTRRVQRVYTTWHSKRRKKVNPNGGGSGPGVGRRTSGHAPWLRPVHNLLQHHQRHHCRHSNGGHTPVATGGEELEMRSLPVPGRDPSVTPGLGSSLLGRLNGGMNYPTILPSFVCSYRSFTPKPLPTQHHIPTHPHNPLPTHPHNPLPTNLHSPLPTSHGPHPTQPHIPLPTQPYSPLSRHPHSPQPTEPHIPLPTQPQRPLPSQPSPLSENSPDPLSKLHQLMGQHSRPRLLYQLAGVVPSPLLLELLGCPLCARALEGMELDLSDLEGGRGGRGRRRRKTGLGAGLGLGVKRASNRLLDLGIAFRDRLKRIVDSKYFNRGIMTSILINTLSMGIEYHQQPVELTDILEISNIVFTCMFLLEMLFKLLAFGLFGYIKNPYNIFDSIIVIISVWEIVGQADGGLSVLRTFRLLRVLKLVRFLPALRRQLVVLMKTMDNVATFCTLLMLFIFTFSILGMHLFGCKFNQQMENGDTIPDRKNFDSLLWAIVTVFQILTQEDWNVVLYNGMASTSPLSSLYFVALMTFGNYVLFNLLVAILVEGFQAEGDANRADSDDDKRSDDDGEEEKKEKVEELKDTELKMYSLMMTANGHADRNTLAPPITITRTAATPVPTPKSSLGPESVLGEGLVYGDVCSDFGDSRRGSAAASIDPSAYDQRSLSSPGQHSPLPPRGQGSVSGWGSRRSSWNSLNRSRTSGERESLLSGEGGGEEEEGALELLQVSSLGPSVTGEYGDCNGRSLHHMTYDPNKDLSPDDDMEEDNLWFRVRRTLQSHKPRWCREHEDWNLYLFSPQNSFRVWAKGMISHKMFDHVVLLFIFLNCITIALERPGILPHSTERVFLSVSNFVFTIIFLAEMTVKIVALGFCWGKQSYLKSSWNVLDGILVFVSLVDILVSLALTGGNRILGILRVLRLLRTLRPLRVISRLSPGLKSLFKGKFYLCEGPDTRNISTKADCLLANYRWTRRKYNFDNLGQALMSLFVLSCKDGWVNIMYDGLDAVGVDQQPVRNHNPWMLLYFISFLLIVSFFVLNMFVGVVVENFHKCRQDQEEEEQRLREEKRLKILEKKRRSKEKDGAEAQQRPYYADYSPVRLSIHTLCTSHYLDLFITVIIGINVVTMSMEHYNQPQYLEEALKYCNYLFTCIFIIETLLKLVAFGLHRFFKDRWNQLDLAIVLLSIMGITLEELKMNASLPINPTIIRIMRVLRIARVLKLLKMATGMRALLDTVMQALPQVGNLGLLFMLLFFIYAALGVELFGKLECNDSNPCEGLSRHATFENFGMAFLTLFRVSTGDNWNGIMKDTLRECRPEERSCLTYLPLMSPVYFVTFVLMAQFVLVNVVVAVLMKHLEESNKEAKEDAEMDAEIALEMERARRLSSASNASALGGAYVGPRPHSPGQEEEGQCSQEEELLSPRKMSVSRMHSLPNDSYMFPPVRCDSAPYPLQEHSSPLHQASVFSSGSVTSVHSQPCEDQAVLPGLSHPGPPHIAPPRPSPRGLRRQVAVKVQSVASVDRQDPLSTLRLLSPSPSRPPSPPFLSDPADEEVWHITSSARHWWDRHGSGRCHSLSPYASPDSPPSLRSRGSALSLLGAGLQAHDPRKGFSVDTQGFLDKPRCPDDQRRHSIEICPSPPEDPLLGELDGEERRPRGPGSEVRGHRKKRMSPPCISIHPPCDPAGRAPSDPQADCNPLLRRRTPSYDVADAHTPTHRLTPTHTPTLTPTHHHTLIQTLPHAVTHTPTHTHTHRLPHAHTLIRTHTLPHSHTHTPSPTHTLSLNSDTRPSSLYSDYKPLPQFTFDQPEHRYTSGMSAGLSSIEPATSPSHFNSRAGFSSMNRRTAQ